MRNLAALICAFVLFTGADAWGQAAGTASGSSLWGKVTDETGGVLPGVTVTVQGPSLMGVQSLVTNEQGVYRFPSLPPGDFTVTFSLPGFNTVVREGVHLTAAFTATIDVQLKVSAVAETVMVVGQSPVVDAVNARVQTSYSKDLLAALPAARDMWAILSSAPAVQMTRIDVGGSTAGTQTGYRAYGVSGQTKPLVEGVIGLEGNGSVGFYYDYGSFDEVNIQTAGAGAEMATPGVMQIFISKSGGNTFHGDFYTDYENRDTQWRNLTADQLARGVRKDGNIVWVNRDLNFGAGGPIMKDKLWYYGSFRYQHIEFMYPTLPDRPFLTTINDYTAKLTYQLPGNNKVVPYIMWGLKKQPYRHDSFQLGNTGFQEGEKSTWNQWNPGWVWKLEWNKTFGSKVFAEARIGQWFDDWHQSPRSSDPRREDVTANFVYGGNRKWLRHQNRPQSTGALTYYNDRWGGSHNLKLGYELQMDQSVVRDASYPGSIVHILRNGVPSDVYFLASGVDADSRLYWYSGYLTDTFTRNRVSINAGLRFDHYRHMYPDQARPASRFYTAESFPGRDLTNWNLFAPRIGVSWDVTGGSKNVLKASYGRYYWNRAARDLVPNVNPNSELQWRRYRWTDLNGNGLWDEGEQGALLGTRGGVAAQAIDPNLKDTYTDQVTFWFDRELAERFGVRAGFVWNRHSRRDGAFNVMTPPEAYNIPVQVRDPGPDGRAGTSDDGQMLSLLNLTPSLIGQTKNVFMNAPDPDYSEEARNIEIVANRRFSNRWSMTASYAVTWRNDYNGIPYNPNGAPQSDFVSMTFVKLSGSYEPGWGLRLSPLVRYQSGTPYGRRASVSMNYGSQTVLIEPTGTRRMDAPLIFDLRAERMFRLPRGTTAAVVVDLFNIANSNAEVDINTMSSSTYQWPIAVLPPRVLRFGVKFSW